MFDEHNAPLFPQRDQGRIEHWVHHLHFPVERIKHLSVTIATGASTEVDELEDHLPYEPVDEGWTGSLALDPYNPGITAEVSGWRQVVYLGTPKAALFELVILKNVHLRTKVSACEQCELCDEEIDLQR